jgi:DNA polymerase IV
MHCPNDDFIELLKVIRHARELESDQQHHAFSAKSYSASMAVIQAYPYRIRSEAELLRLPGCGEKVAKNWIEWKETGQIEEVNQIQNDERLKALDTFWNIHQVADTTARKFYDHHGWKDLEDLVEYGWDMLTRDQQIGLKFYDELTLRIPRQEVSETEQIILEHANRLHPGFKICTAGGYRRGKETCGDMDFILSHPDESVTQNFIGHLLDALRESEYIRYELTVSFRNSERGQETLAWRGLDGKKRSAGFDTLDHAFVVWKDPRPHPEEGKEYPHRRVDIIISPWKTAGCAVLGWSGGKLFEQHLRSWVKEKKGWKFDSSGVRHRGTGTWIDLERRAEDKGRETGITLEEKEKRVFEGLGLKYLEPTMRCTN